MWAANTDFAGRRGAGPLAINNNAFFFASPFQNLVFSRRFLW